MKKIIWTFVYLFFLLIASIAIGALVGYASSMIVLVFGLFKYGEYIMFGAFFLSAVAIFAANVHSADEVVDKHYDDPHPKRDYFKDGDFSFKRR